MRLADAMEVTTFERVLVEDASQVGEARRTCAQACLLVHPDIAARASLVVTELATNLVRHAVNGEILIRSGIESIEICSIDRGPGFADFDRSAADGFSTFGSQGNGIGAVKRACDQFEVFSNSSGTIVWCEVGKSRRNQTGLEWHSLSLCHPHEQICGDRAWLEIRGSKVWAAVIDGLGHGPLAADVAERAVEILSGNWDSAEDALGRCNERLLHGRGAAAAAAVADLETGQLDYAGVGNVSGSLVDANSRKGLMSYNGTLGTVNTKIRPMAYSWKGASTLVLHSDGLTEKWWLNPVPSLASGHPALLTCAIYRDCHRGTDDSTILVVKLKQREVLK